MRNQSIVGSKLPELSEAAEQEKGDNSCLTSCPQCAISSTFTNPAKGVHFLNLRANLFQFENNDDGDHLFWGCFFFMCFFFSVPPIYWQSHGTETLLSFSHQ